MTSPCCPKAAYARKKRKTLAYTYNAYGILKKKSQTGLGSFSSSYDSLGRLYYLSDSVNSRKTYYYYDRDSRLTGQSVYSSAKSNAYETRMFAVQNGYDENGNKTKEILSAKDTRITNTFSYSESGMPTASAMTSIRTISYTYDSQNRLKGRSLSTVTPVAESFTYTDDGAVATHSINDATRNDTYSYSYSESGNITEIKKNENVIRSYEYDADNQLIRENNAEVGKTATFTYDNGGNITSKKEYAYTVGDLGAVQSTKNYTYDGTWKDKLTSYNGQSITYDAIGNPTNYMGATMTWFGRQMMSYTDSDTAVTYKYDENGLRTQKTVGGVQYDYFYSDGQLLYEKRGSEYELFYRYEPDGRLGLVLKRRISDNYKWYYYPVSNSRGDIVEIHDGGGRITAKYNYDAWGKLLFCPFSFYSLV